MEHKLVRRNGVVCRSFLDIIINPEYPNKMKTTTLVSPLLDSGLNSSSLLDRTIPLSVSGASKRQSSQPNFECLHCELDSSNSSDLDHPAHGNDVPAVAATILPESLNVNHHETTISSPFMQDTEHYVELFRSFLGIESTE